MARGRRQNGKDESPKVKVTRESLREALVLFRYLKPYRSKFILSLVFIALSAFTTSLFPLFLGKMIDAASAGVPSDSNAFAGIGAMFGEGLRNDILGFDIYSFTFTS